jgi:hypothetical protein
MTRSKIQVIPPVAFKNIIVTVSEDGGTLLPHCVEFIGCNTRDTLLNFQLSEPAHPERDYRFSAPGLRGDVDQLGAFTISQSGKMLTVCNATSKPSTINITLNVFDHIKPAHKGSFDPEVANQPDGMIASR